MVNIEWLRYFVTLAGSPSVAAAAEQLHITPQTLSHALAGLEQFYGQVLVDRGARLRGLTPAGAALLPEARTLLVGLENTDRLMAEFKEDRPRGPVRIGATTILNSAVLPSLLAEIVTAFPEITPKLYAMRSSDIEVRVASGDIDFGLFLRPAKHPGVESLEVLRSPFLVIGKPQPMRPWHEHGYVVPRHFPEDRLTNPNPCASDHGLEERWQHEGHGRRITVESDQFETTIALCEAGAGVAFLPEIVARRFIQLGTLAVVAEAPYFYDEPITAVWRKGARLPAAGAKVLEALRALAAAD